MNWIKNKIMLKKIQKEVEDLSIKVYAGQSLEDTEKALYKIEQMLSKAMDKQLNIPNVSKSFNSEEELLQFIYMHTPIAIKPKSKRAKGQLVSAFKSGNAFDQVCRHLAKKLFNVC